MKKFTYIFIIGFCILTACDSSNTSQQDSTTRDVSTEGEKQITAAKEFEFKNPDRPVEDTLILKTGNGGFLITPSGLFRTTTGDTIQLKTKLIVDKAYLYKDEKYYYVFFTDTDHEGATSWVQKISRDLLKSEYVKHIPGFNLGQPIIDEQFAYISALGFIGKIDLQTGEYAWKHKDLYDNEKYSFNSFDTVLLKQNQTEFISENYKNNNIDKVIVDNKKGEILSIKK